jgi:hypothetical protein
MSSIEDILYLISKQICIYTGLSILIGGVVCNILNIAVFTQLTIFRRNQSTFYFISGSIVDCIQLLITFTFRLRLCTFGYDLGPKYIIWCRIGPTIAQTCRLISTGNVRFRQMSTVKLAHYLTYILVFFTSLPAIPYAIFYEVDPKFGCAPHNPIFIKYVSFVQFCVLIGLLPISISSIFAALAYQNVRHIIRHQVPVVRRRLDRQLTAMVLIRVCLFIITTLPYIALQIYQLNVPSNTNDSLRTAINQLISVITFAIVFLNYSVFNLLKFLIRFIWKYF